jgi:hypothetical protein
VTFVVTDTVGAAGVSLAWLRHLPLSRPDEPS